MHGHGPQPQKIELPGVKHIVAVASGKGGVGKSTVAVNLAVALRQRGKTVGLLDADIYGPSVPLMVGLNHLELQPGPVPFEQYGLKLASMGFFPEARQGIMVRGPIVARYITMLLSQIQWGDLDYLIIDMPPGTGDAQLTLSQQAELTGAVIVTTPQDVSLLDAGKGLNMFAEVRVPVLGIVENMSYFIGDDGKRYEIFRHGGGKKLAKTADVPFLGEIAIDPRIAECGDAGIPIVYRNPELPVSQSYFALADAVAAEAERRKAERDAQKLPEVQL
jgi:ATP-binding protein involved in chromosome partitioning